MSPELKPSQDTKSLSVGLESRKIGLLIGSTVLVEEFRSVNRKPVSNSFFACMPKWWMTDIMREASGGHDVAEVTGGEPGSRSGKFK